MGIPTVSYCYHGDGSGESIPDGDLPIAILNPTADSIGKKKARGQTSYAPSGSQCRENLGIDVLDFPNPIKVEKRRKINVKPFGSITGETK
jgi:hypothetical protein